jgi:hypothetical protein
LEEGRRKKEEGRRKTRKKEEVKEDGRLRRVRHRKSCSSKS